VQLDGAVADAELLGDDLAGWRPIIEASGFSAD